MATPTLDSTFGAILIGVVVSAILYGMTNIQTILYFSRYPNDAESTKTFVAIIWMLDTFHVALILKAIYYYLITNFADSDVQAIDGHWSLYVSVIVNLLTSLLVQTFFTVQIFHLCSRRLRYPVTFGIAILIVAHFAFGIETASLLFIKKQLSRLSEIILIAPLPLAVFAVLSDVAIAAGLCVLLHGNRSTFTHTNALITTLIGYAINRCLLTSIVAIIEVIVLLVSPRSFWFLALDFTAGKRESFDYTIDALLTPSSKVWANSMLASLNNRRALRRGSMMHSMNAIAISPLQFSRFSEPPTGSPEVLGNSLHQLASKRLVSDTDSHPSSQQGPAGIGGRPHNCAALHDT
ncbi:hypothetical protein JOM56_014080 [Amanita muscaria]